MASSKVQAKRQLRTKMASSQQIQPDDLQEFPLVQVSLECPSQISLGQDVIKVKARITYTGISTPTPSISVTPSKPITIHLANMTNSMDYRYGQFIFERWDPTASTWQEVPGIENTCGFALFDNPPKRVKVGERSDHEFLTLHTLGDSAIVTGDTVYREDAGESFLSYVRDINVSDRFRVRYTSTTLDWWAWGTKEGDLKDVEVWLPCWEHGVVVDVPDGHEEVESAVLKEGDNGGRPKLKVAEAVPVEFEIV